jgi:hypothetical protein
LRNVAAERVEGGDRFLRKLFRERSGVKVGSAIEHVERTGG